MLSTMLLLALTLPILAGCPHRPEVQEAVPGALAPFAPGSEAAKPTMPAEAPEAPSTKVPEEFVTLKKPAVIKEGETPQAPVAPASPLKDIFFDFDKALIREEMQQVLDENVRWLKAHPKARITIEGHCDERGTNEYNLALGEQRAKAAREYLVAAGIDPGRISIISFGEERPFVLGHDESAWKWNRRAHFVIMAP